MYFFYLYKINYKISLIYIYVLHCFILDINQIRNLFCILFIYIGLFYLKNKKSIKYLIFNIIAIFFHNIGYIYILFYLLQKFNFKKYKKVIFYIFFSGYLVLFSFDDIFLKIFPSQAPRYLFYKPNLGKLIYYLLAIIDIVILLIGNRGKKIKSEEKKYIEFILFPIIFLPFSYFTLELMSRIYRNSFFIKWFYFFRYIKNKNKKSSIFILWILIILQQIIILIANIYKNPIKTFNLLKQISNIEFYF